MPNRAVAGGTPEVDRAPRPQRRADQGPALSARAGAEPRSRGQIGPEGRCTCVKTRCLYNACGRCDLLGIVAAAPTGPLLWAPGTLCRSALLVLGPRHQWQNPPAPNTMPTQSGYGCSPLDPCPSDFVEAPGSQSTWVAPVVSPGPPQGRFPPHRAPAPSRQRRASSSFFPSLQRRQIRDRRARAGALGPRRPRRRSRWLRRWGRWRTGWAPHPRRWIVAACCWWETRGAAPVPGRWRGGPTRAGQ
mmetsp:Transcript_56091/g.128781  ORF Transcript_56091/g.128781 Transcript_56091/m.128781 type:complete len:246 (+) Transcript_56091:196-933(+)